MQTHFLNYQFFKYLSSIMDEEEQIAEVVHLSLGSIHEGFQKVKEGLNTENAALIKAGFHLMSPNLIHIELEQFVGDFPDADDPDFFKKSQGLIDRLEPEVARIEQINNI